MPTARIQVVSFTSIAMLGATLTHGFAVPPLPMGEGGPQPALSPAGAVRVRVRRDYSRTYEQCH